MAWWSIRRIKFVVRFIFSVMIIGFINISLVFGQILIRIIMFGLNFLVCSIGLCLGHIYCFLIHLFCWHVKCLFIHICCFIIFGVSEGIILNVIKLIWCVFVIWILFELHLFISALLMRIKMDISFITYIVRPKCATICIALFSFLIISFNSLPKFAFR